MTPIVEWLSEHSGALLRVTILVAVGLPVIRLLGVLLGKLVKKRMTDQSPCS